MKHRSFNVSGKRSSRLQSTQAAMLGLGPAPCPAQALSMKLSGQPIPMLQGLLHQQQTVHKQLQQVHVHFEGSAEHAHRSRLWSMQDGIFYEYGC